MTWVIAIVGAVITHWMLPFDTHARAMRIVGHVELAPDERLVARWRARALRTPGQPRTTLLVQMLVAELAAGALTSDAFAHVLGPECASPEQLEANPPTVDARVWHDVAHVWRASNEAGFSMAGALQRIHAYALVDQEVTREVQSTAAAPRFALFTVMAMPLVMWCIGGGMGADPIAFLLRQPIGWACALGGASLFAVAWIWMRRLTRSAVG